MSPEEWRELHYKEKVLRKRRKIKNTKRIEMENKDLIKKFESEMEILGPKIEEYYYKKFKNTNNSPIKIETLNIVRDFINDGKIKRSGYKNSDNSMHWTYDDLICSYFYHQGWFVFKKDKNDYKLYPSKLSFFKSQDNIYLLICLVILSLFSSFLLCIIAETAIINYSLQNNLSFKASEYCFPMLDVIIISCVTSIATLWVSVKSEKGFAAHESP